MARGGLAWRPGSLAAALAVVTVWTTWWAWRAWSVSGISWHYFADGGRLLVGSAGLHVYADHPELQTGPLSLLVAAALRPLGAGGGEKVALVAMTAAGPLLLAVLAPLVDARRRALRVLLAGLVLAPAWTVLSVRWGHLDDVLAMAAAVVAVRAVSAGRPALAGVALAAAVACKPWAVAFLPMVLSLPVAAAVSAAAVAVTGAVLAWSPFVAADPSTLDAMRPDVALVRSSGLHALGVRGRVVPSWGRATQFVVSTTVAAVAALTGRWPGVLLVAVAVRLALDPQDNAYYVGSAALAAVVFDLLGTRRTIPWTTIVTVLALWQPFVHDYAHRMSTTGGLTHWWFAHPGTVGAVHLAWSVAMVAAVLLTPRAGSSPNQEPATQALNEPGRHGYDLRDEDGGAMNDTWNYRDSAWSEGGDVVGYDVEATDGSIGTIDRATADVDAAYLVVDTGSWITGSKRLIPAGLVTQVDHDTHTVTLTLSKDQVRAGPDYEEGVDADEVVMSEHSDYYGPFSWGKSVS